MSLDRDALDRHITGGRYRKQPIRVECGECGEWTSVLAETEYGTTEWTPDECSSCHAEFTSESKWEDDEPPEPDYPDPDLDFDGPWDVDPDRRVV